MVSLALFGGFVGAGALIGTAWGAAGLTWGAASGVRTEAGGSAALSLAGG